MQEPNVSAGLISEYETKRHLFNALHLSCQRLVGELLQMEGLQVLSISGRVKTKESLSEKVTRLGKQYKTLNDVTDLVGLRIVTFFEDDVDKVAKLLEREFSLVREHCVDKRAYVEPDRFGYRSLHYVCCLSEPRRSLTENAMFSKEVFEVQVRSILQHAWAEIEHDLGYKGAVSIPNEIKRQLSRVSGLLEIADRDFREIRDKSSAYRQRVAAELKLNQVSELELDSISLAEFISTSPVVKELDNFLHDELAYQIRPDTDQETTLELLKSAGITSLEELQRSLTANLEILKFYAKTILSNHFDSEENMWVHTGLSIFHLPQILMARRGYKELSDLYTENCLGGPDEGFDYIQNVIDIVEAIDEEFSGRVV